MNTGTKGESQARSSTGTTAEWSSLGPGSGTVNRQSAIGVGNHIRALDHVQERPFSLGPSYGL